MRNAPSRTQALCLRTGQRLGQPDLNEVVCQPVGRADVKGAGAHDLQPVATSCARFDSASACSCPSNLLTHDVRQPQNAQQARSGLGRDVGARLNALSMQDNAAGRSEMQKQHAADVESLREQNTELTAELAWAVKDLLRLRAQENKGRCLEWLLRSEGLSTVRAATHATVAPSADARPSADTDSHAVSVNLTERAVAQAGGVAAFAGLCPADEQLVAQLESSERPSAAVVERMRAAWMGSRHTVTLLTARVLRLEQQLRHIGAAASAAPQACSSSETRAEEQQHCKCAHAEGEHTRDRKADSAVSPVQTHQLSDMAALAAEHTRVLAQEKAGADERLRAAVAEAQAWRAPEAEGLRDQLAQLQRRLAECCQARMAADDAAAASRSAAEIASAAQHAAESRLAAAEQREQDADRVSRAELQRLQASVAEAEAGAQAAMTSQREAQASALDLRQQVDQAQQQIVAVRSAEQAALRGARTEAHEARRRADELAQEAAMLQQQLAECQAARDAAAEQQSAQLAQLSALQEQVDEAGEEAQRLQGVVSKRDDRLAAQAHECGTLAAQRMDAQAQRDRMQAELRAAQVLHLCWLSYWRD